MPETFSIVLVQVLAGVIIGVLLLLVEYAIVRPLKSKELAKETYSARIARLLSNLVKTSSEGVPLRRATRYPHCAQVKTISRRC